MAQSSVSQPPPRKLANMQNAEHLAPAPETDSEGDPDAGGSRRILGEPLA